MLTYFHRSLCCSAEYGVCNTLVSCWLSSFSLCGMVSVSCVLSTECVLTILQACAAVVTLQHLSKVALLLVRQARHNKLQQLPNDLSSRPTSAAPFQACLLCSGVEGLKAPGLVAEITLVYLQD